MSHRVLVVLKQSLMDTMGGASKDASFGAMLEKNDAARARHELAHQENQNSAESVLESLARAGCSVDIEDSPGVGSLDDYDLVIPVGGDGTFLRTAQRVRSAVMLGVNSSVSSSVGRYCGAHTGNFQETLEGILNGTLRPSVLHRLGVSVDGVELAPPVLNEVLYTHKIPAGTSRYVLDVSGRQERHKSSGVWLASPSGSTGAIHSAGGAPMDLSVPRVQYLVREPYLTPGATLKMRNETVLTPIRIMNQMRNAALFIDGPRVVHDLTWGSEIVVTPGAYPLNVHL